MNPAQWKTFAQRLRTADSKPYKATKHQHKVQKRIARPNYKSIPFAVEIVHPELPFTGWVNSFTQGVGLGSYYIPTHMTDVHSRYAQYSQHRGKERRVCDKIKQLHKEICGCKHFTIGKVSTIEFSTIESSTNTTMSKFRVSCRQSVRLEFQLAFEDELNECFNYVYI